MTDQEKLVKALKELGRQPLQMIPAEVTEVDESGPHCTVKPVDGVEIYEVRLRAALDNSDEGIWAVPAKGSFVLVGLIGNNLSTAYVAQYSKVDKWVAKIGSITFEMSNDGIKLNGDSLDGLVKVGELANRISKLENAMDTHSHPTAATGPASTVVAPFFPVKTQKSDLENTNVKHG